jgi:hypothetical protein
MTKGFAYWFGELDLNQPIDDGDVSSFNRDGADPSAPGPSSDPSVPGTSSDPGPSTGPSVPGTYSDPGPSAGPSVNATSAGPSNPRTTVGPSGGDDQGVDGFSTAPSNRGPTVRSAAHTGVTLSSEESGSGGEVQSTPEGFVPKIPYVGMVFDSLEDALLRYNRYAKHLGFSVKIESSRKSTKDGEKDKSVFVCNKRGKNPETEETPVKKRNCTITVLMDWKAKMHVKRIGERWHVTQFVEEHTHELIQKFALKKYLRSHKKIPPEERQFIGLLHELNLSSGRIMQLMGELYGSKKNVPYDHKTVSNYTATLGGEPSKDIPELLNYFEELKEQDPSFYYKYKLDDMSRVERIF